MSKQIEAIRASVIADDILHKKCKEEDIIYPYNPLAEDRRVLIAHIDKLESALSFYADPCNNGGKPSAAGYVYGRVWYDKGDKAREALNEVAK